MLLADGGWWASIEKISPLSVWYCFVSSFFPFIPHSRWASIEKISPPQCLILSCLFFFPLYSSQSVGFNRKDIAPQCLGLEPQSAPAPLLHAIYPQEIFTNSGDISESKNVTIWNLLRQENKGRSVGYALSLKQHSGHSLSKFESCLHFDIQFATKIVSFHRVSELIVFWWYDAFPLRAGEAGSGFGVQDHIVASGTPQGVFDYLSALFWDGA